MVYKKLPIDSGSEPQKQRRGLQSDQSLTPSKGLTVPKMPQKNYQGQGTPLKKRKWEGINGNVKPTSDKALNRLVIKNKMKAV